MTTNKQLFRYKLSTITTKVLDLIYIHKFFLSSPIGLSQKLKQLFNSYHAVLANRKKFDYLSRNFFTSSRFDPILLLTYPKEIAFLKEAINEFNPENVIDVGANIGQWGRTFKHFYPDANLYSFEPFHQAFNVLETNSLNIPAWNIFNLAIGDTRDNFLYMSKHGSAEHSLVKSEPNMEQVKVKTETLTSKLVPKNIDLLKIDTEGYDLEVIKNTKGLEIGYLSIEVDVKGLKSNLKEIQNTIKKYWHKNSKLIGVQTLWANSPKGNAILRISKN